jgi:hypothetical protein
LAAYDPSTDAWRTAAPAPVTLGGGSVSGVWTDDELVLWSDAAAAAWAPGTDTWRIIPIEPSELSPYGHVVWTGTEIIDVWSGRAADPESGTTRPTTPLPPGAGSRPAPSALSATLVDGHVVVMPGRWSYDVATDTWAQPGPTPIATYWLPILDAVWTGSEVFAWNADMRAAGYQPATDTWTTYPDIPLRIRPSPFCPDSAHHVGRSILVAACAGLAVWEPETRQWLPMAAPTLSSEYRAVSTGDELYAITGNRDLFRLAPSVLESGPGRVAVGVKALDLPDGWTLQTVAYETASVRLGASQPHTISAALEGPEATCEMRAIFVVTALHGDFVASTLGAFRLPGTEPVSLDLAVGGDPIEAILVPAGTYDEAHHLVWAFRDQDVVDVACDDQSALTEIARNVWSPSDLD